MRLSTDGGMTPLTGAIITLRIISNLPGGQIWIKRTILEMGGKDSIVVDETSNLHDAAQGIVAAAFGFQGQKCSACSRAIVVKDIYDELLEKVIERTKKITVGPVKNYENYMGPVIDKYVISGTSIMVGTGFGRYNSFSFLRHSYFITITSYYIVPSQ